MTADLKSLTLEQIEELVTGWNWPKYRARQLAAWIFQKDAGSFADMSDFPLDFRRQLAAGCRITRLDMLAREASFDGSTVKFLWGLEDGHAVESVLLRHEYGYSACVSTQVGCRMSCLFCASTLGGLVRNLTAGEIYDQVLALQRAEGVRVGRIVIMGTGEPLDNYDATMGFIANVTAPYGLNIGQRRITLSTCGLVPGIKRLASLRLQLTLAVSLHAPNNALRDRLVPINRRYPLEELIPACRDYAVQTGRRVTFEYALIKDLNDAPEHAVVLTELLRGVHCHINLIPVNTVLERGFNPPDRRTVLSFQSTLESKGFPVTVRKEMGAEIGAACGQLRRRYEGKGRER